MITGLRRRRNWSDEEKARILCESAAPNANISEVARRNGMNRGLLTAWRRQAGLTRPRGCSAKVAGEPPMFVPLEIAPDPGTGAVTGDGRRGLIEFEFVGGRIVIGGDIDPRLASAVVAAVRSRS
ncbi:transposase [Aurantimonas sp. C2-6-R+9]|uniref:IS66-like element accessory protein TnpA n=1 Tax=unclassified Aurantimonas TaxID=2638230 RepID=UPI002E1924F4|nr:transposase [Aurantimonas sp. C2-6-R+9]